MDMEEANSNFFNLGLRFLLDHQLLCLFQAVNLLTFCCLLLLRFGDVNVFLYMVVLHPSRCNVIINSPYLGPHPPFGFAQSDNVILEQPLTLTGLLAFS